MIDAVIVHDGGIQRVGKRERTERFLAHAVDRGDALFDVVAGDHQYENPVHAIAMQALGCGVAFIARTGLDAELMHLDMPDRGFFLRRRQGIRDPADDADGGGHGGMGGDGVRYGRKPALDAAIEQVVIPALVMGLVFLAGDGVARDGEGRITAAAVTAAIRHVAVKTQMVPALGKSLPVRQAFMLKQRACDVGLQEGKPFFQQRIFDAGQNPVKGRREIGRVHEFSDQGTQGWMRLRPTFPL